MHGCHRKGSQGLIYCHINDARKMHFYQFSYILIRVPLVFPNAITPWHEISNNVVCATSKASDQPEHTRSLIRAFAGRLSIL